MEPLGVGIHRRARTGIGCLTVGFRRDDRPRGVAPARTDNCQIVERPMGSLIRPVLEKRGGLAGIAQGWIKLGAPKGLPFSRLVSPKG